MSKESLKKDLEALEDVERVRRVNSIKEIGINSQFGELVELEIDDLKDQYNAAIMANTGTNEALCLLVHRLQGIEQVKRNIFSKWEEVEKDG